MISVSTAFLNMMQVRTNFQPSAVVTLADETTINLTANDFIILGNTLTEAAGGGSLPVGYAISRTVRLELVNDDGRFDDVSFVDAEIALSLSYNTGSSTETVGLGTFTVKQPGTAGATVILEAQDDMYKADHLFTTSLTYPTTAYALFTEICTNTGIQTDAQSIPQGTAAISTAPSSDLTYRQVLGYIAMLSGGNARISRSRKLEIINYNFSGMNTIQGSATFADDGNGNVTGEGTFTVTDDGNGNLTVQLTATDSGSGDVTISSGGSASYHELNLWKNLTSDIEDITITGISTTKSTDNGGFDIVTVGQEGNVLTISNPLIAGREQAALTAMWSYLEGATYRPFSGEHVAYPLAEFGDICHVSDGLGRSFFSIVTDMTFEFNNLTTLSASAETKESTGAGTLSQKVTRISADVAEIQKLKVGWAEIDEAVIGTLEAEGINADWIDTGALTVKDANDNVVFHADADTGEVEIGGSTVTYDSILTGNPNGAYTEIGNGVISLSGSTLGPEIGSGNEGILVTLPRATADTSYLVRVTYNGAINPPFQIHTSLNGNAIQRVVQVYGALEIENKDNPGTVFDVYNFLKTSTNDYYSPTIAWLDGGAPTVGDQSCQMVRAGNVMMLHGRFYVDAVNAPATNSLLTMTLPTGVTVANHVGAIGALYKGYQTNTDFVARVSSASGPITFGTPAAGGISSVMQTGYHNFCLTVFVT